MATTLYQSCIIDRCKADLIEALQPRLAFSDLLDDLEPHACARADLIAAIEAAPSRELRLYLYGIYEFREMLVIAIGAKF